MEKGKKKNKLVISPLLKAFIEKEFQSMLRYEEELKKDRNHRRDLERKEQREFMRIKRKHMDIERKNPNPFSSVLKEMSTREIAVKGKAKYDFNEFVYMCDYFLQKENQEALELRKCHRKDIHDWISRFLTSKEYRKEIRNRERTKTLRKTYTSNGIRRIINEQFESHLQQEIKYLTSLFEHMFEDFCNKWNEEAKSELLHSPKTGLHFHKFG